jgi:hypothetical protein
MLPIEIRIPTQGGAMISSISNQFHPDRVAPCHPEGQHATGPQKQDERRNWCDRNESGSLELESKTARFNINA